MENDELLNNVNEAMNEIIIDKFQSRKPSTSITLEHEQMDLIDEFRREFAGMFDFSTFVRSVTTRQNFVSFIENKKKQLDLDSQKTKKIKKEKEELNIEVAEDGLFT